MTRAVFQSYAQDDEGNVLPNASVTVIDEDSGSPVSLFNAYSGGSSLSNPFTADANGFFVFYADPARVKITVTLGGDTSEFRNVRLSGTAAQADLTSPSAIIFDDGNLEVDRYGLSVAVNGVLGVGVVLDSSTVSIYLPTNRKISATSLSVTSTFSVKESDETLIGSGVTVTDMSLSSRLSNRITKINISGFSGLIKNTPVELRAESTSSLIEIT